MRGKTKKPQLRRCGFCLQTGHNKSTCPQRFHAESDVYPEASYKPLKFFVHHVSDQAAPSPHVIDLRKEKLSLWRNVEPAAPAKISNEDYYFYHRPTESPAVKATPEPRREQPKPEKKREVKIKIPTDYAARGMMKKLRTMKEIFTAKRVVTAMILLALVSLAPSGARGYYSNLKSTAAAVKTNGAAGFTALQESTVAILNGDIDEAQKSLAGATRNFDAAVATMQSQHRWLQTIAANLPLVGDNVRDPQKLIAAGQKISLGNTRLLAGIAAVEKNSSSTFSRNIEIVITSFQQAIPNYEQALTDIKTIKPEALPAEYRDVFKNFESLFSVFLNDLKDIMELAKSIEEIFGADGLRRYLLVFQNPDEIRATGGFMGSFAFLDVRDGKILKLDIPAGGTYDLQGQLDQYLEPPAPLLLSNKRWEFQDANWFPDFPASAQKILWFYRHGRKVTADGVLAINASVLNRVLAVTGPIIDSKRGLTLAADNALSQIQQVVEFGAEKKQNKPKQILSDLASQLLGQFGQLNPRDLLPFLTSLLEALQQKEIQAYFSDAATEQTMREFGWGGQVLATYPDQDYLFVVNTNIRGQKSDARIKQKISHQAVVAGDGTITDSVIIERANTGQPGEGLYGQTNIDYVRIYVPEDSELISAGGFVWPDDRNFKVPEPFYKKDPLLAALEKEVKIDGASGTRITNEFGKTAFGNWIITEPGETSRVELVYKLPFRILGASDTAGAKWTKIFVSGHESSRYQLVAQKQSGVNSEFSSQVIFPEGWNPAWREGENITLAANGASISATELNTDKIWSLVMNKE